MAPYFRLFIVYFPLLVVDGECSVCFQKISISTPRIFKNSTGEGGLKATFLKRILLVLTKTEISRGFFFLQGR